MRSLCIAGSFLLWIGCSPQTFRVKTQTQQYVLNSTYPYVKEVDDFIKPYRDSLEIIVDKILAVSEAELTIGRPGADLFPSQVALGNFMTDAVLTIAKQKASELNKPAAEVSIFTWGSFRKSLPSGKITLRNIYELMPFENEMMVMKLSGKQVITLLNQLSENYNPIGGVKMKRADAVSILLDNGRPVQENDSYFVLVSDYHAFGGDNLTILKEATDQYLCGIKMRDALILYLEQLTLANQTLKPNYEPRIKN